MAWCSSSRRPAELYERPVNSFVAQFIGENNKLKGTVAEIDADNVATVKLETGELVKALAVNAKEKGGRTLLSIRPERVEINPTAKTADVILNGRIAELIYLGDHIRARLEVAGHTDFIVKVPNKGASERCGRGPRGEGRAGRLPIAGPSISPSSGTEDQTHGGQPRVQDFRALADCRCCWAIGILLPLPAGRAEDFDVDLALVLAVDCSFSVDAREFDLQMEGLGRAFMREEVKRAIAQGQRQRIAVAVVQWSDDMNQKVVLPWTIISGAADADELGKILFATCRGNWRRAAPRSRPHWSIPPRFSPPPPAPSAG